jgi:hypothetical protein
MFQFRTTAALSLAVVLATLGFAPGALADNCDTYGKLALQQQKDNESRKCGLSGSEWSSNLKAHISWCSSVPPQDWQAMLKKRREALESCKNR